MSPVAMIDVEIVLFDPLKCKESPVQEAGPSCLIGTADVYNCYQARATRGSIMICKTKFRLSKESQIGRESKIYLTRSSVE